MFKVWRERWGHAVAQFIEVLWYKLEGQFSMERRCLHTKLHDVLHSRRRCVGFMFARTWSRVTSCPTQ